MSEVTDRDDAYQKSLRFLCDRINYERMASGTARYPFRLHRTYELLTRLGLSNYLHENAQSHNLPRHDVPHRKVPIVHIAGTKGKGSTATMVAAILTAAGVRTGLYTSPHLNHLTERFRIDSTPCSPEQFTQLVDRIAPVADQLASEDHGSPSFFELTTAVAMLHFDTQQCDAIVLEVGLGGRLDSTNVCQPSVTAITSIGLDHQHVLGDTIAQIAGEKAGIIKPKTPVVSGVRAGDAADVIKRHADDNGAPLFQLGRDFDFDCVPQSDWGSRITYLSKHPSLIHSIIADLPLEGDHQAQNAAIAISIASLLRDQFSSGGGTALNEPMIQSALANLQCPGRIERFLVANDVTVIIDAAHNDDSIAALCDSIRDRFANSPKANSPKASQTDRLAKSPESGGPSHVADSPDSGRADCRKPISIVFGTSRDKSAASMLSQLAPLADTLILTRFEGNPRFTPTSELLPLVPEFVSDRVHVVENPVKACQRGLESVSPGGTMVVCGSFFIAAETRPWVAEQSVDPVT
ncbi:MAG: bifunctional folylpolyglutamate synthase/dihydrofolate synthase [Pirellulaceae bacterium]|nr:bifunctional folylpolyglutamate synthase/dihydrofolate synthase [Pirellulaceae bacterium]